MAQGNITKKDKVNIPDWVGTNLYLENDFVINDNKFYRANGDIPTGETTLTIGTAGATWTEMSPSAGVGAVAEVLVSGEWSNTGNVALNDADGTFRYTCDTELSGQNTSFDSTQNMFGIADAVDKDTTIDIIWRQAIHFGGIISTVSTARYEVALAYTDDSGTTWTALESISYRLALSTTWRDVRGAFPKVTHVAGRKYALWLKSTRVEITVGSTSVADVAWDFPGQATQDLRSHYCSVTLTATV